MSDKEAAVAEGPGEEQEKRNGFGGKGRRGRNLFRLRKGEKIVERRRRRRPVAAWCCLCGKPAAVPGAESAGESPTSDPDSREFTFDMLRSLIEKNDFYSKECNPHLGNLDLESADD